MSQIQKDKQFNRLSFFSKFPVICCIVNVIFSCHLPDAGVFVVPGVSACTWISIWSGSDLTPWMKPLQSVVNQQTFYQEDRRCRSLCSFPLGDLTEPEHRLAMTFLRRSLSRLFPLIQTWWITFSSLTLLQLENCVTGRWLRLISAAYGGVCSPNGVLTLLGYWDWGLKEKGAQRNFGVRKGREFERRVNWKSSSMLKETVSIISISWKIMWKWIIEMHWEA